MKKKNQKENVWCQKLGRNHRIWDFWITGPNERWFPVSKLCLDRPRAFPCAV